MIIYQKTEVAVILFDDVDQPEAVTAFAAPGTSERHKKIPLPDALPDCKTKLKCNEDDDHPFQEI
jgi:hypothetical protein